MKITCKAIGKGKGYKEFDKTELQNPLQQQSERMTKVFLER